MEYILFVRPEMPLRACYCHTNLPVIKANRRDVRLSDALKNAFQNSSHCIPDLRTRDVVEKTVNDAIGSSCVGNGLKLLARTPCKGLAYLNCCTR